MSLRIATAVQRALLQENLTLREAQVLAAFGPDEGKKAAKWISLADLTAATGLKKPVLFRSIVLLGKPDPSPWVERKQEGNLQSVAYRRTRLGTQLLAKIEKVGAV